MAFWEKKIPEQSGPRWRIKLESLRVWSRNIYGWVLIFIILKIEHILFSFKGIENTFYFFIDKQLHNKLQSLKKSYKVFLSL